MNLPHGETVTRLRAVRVVDPYSLEPTGLDWSTPEMLDIAPCAVYPASTDELIGVGRDQKIETLRVLLPPGADVAPEDRLRVRGVVYEISGWPFDYLHPMTGWRPGGEVTITRSEG